MCRFHLHVFISGTLSYIPVLRHSLAIFKIKKRKKEERKSSLHLVISHCTICDLNHLKFMPEQYFCSFLISGNTQPQLSQLAESLWTDPGLKDKSGVRKLISTLKQNNLKTRRRGMNRQTFPYSRVKGGTMPLHHHHIDLKIKC